MTFLINSLAPGISLYENVIDFSEKIIDLSNQDTRNWIIRNQDATDWELGNKILGYDEYPVSFSFSVDEHFLLLAKKIFTSSSDYATKNLTTIDGFDSCMIRKYSFSPAFLELESSDVDNVSRKITSILFLNDLDDGGTITFKNFECVIKPKKNNLLVFPASFIYSFKINKPKTADNFIVVSHFV